MLADFRNSIAFEGSKALPICPSQKSSMQMNMKMENWLKDTGRENRILRLKLA
jgi:hypothetical protein